MACQQDVLAEAETTVAPQQQSNLLLNLPSFGQLAPDVPLHPISTIVQEMMETYIKNVKVKNALLSISLLKKRESGADEKMLQLLRTNYNR